MTFSTRLHRGHGAANSYLIRRYSRLAMNMDVHFSPDAHGATWAPAIVSHCRQIVETTVHPAPGRVEDDVTPW
jgi:hypothetical protein